MLLSADWLEKKPGGYVNTWLVFWFISRRYDLHLIQSNLIPPLINDKEADSRFIKKTYVIKSLKFGDIQFLGIMKFLGGATQLDSFLKANKVIETKVIWLMGSLTE